MICVVIQIPGKGNNGQSPWGWCTWGMKVYKRGGNQLKEGTPKSGNSYKQGTLPLYDYWLLTTDYWLLTLWRLDSSFSKKVGAPDNSRPSKDRLRWLLWGDVDPTTIPKEFLWIRFRFWMWFVTRNVGGGGGFEDPVSDWLCLRLVLKQEGNCCCCMFFIANILV